MNNTTMTADEMEKFIQFLEGKIGYVKRDAETLQCLQSIMQTKINVFGDPYLE